MLMKLDIVIQWVLPKGKVPPDESLANGSEGRFRGKPGNGSPKHEPNEATGRVIEPRNVYIRGHEDKRRLSHRCVKVDLLQLWGRQQSEDA